MGDEHSKSLKNCIDILLITFVHQQNYQIRSNLNWVLEMSDWAAITVGSLGTKDGLQFPAHLDATYLDHGEFQLECIFVSHSRLALVQLTLSSLQPLHGVAVTVLEVCVVCDIAVTLLTLVLHTNTARTEDPFVTIREDPFVSKFNPCREGSTQECGGQTGSIDGSLTREVFYVQWPPVYMVASRGDIR